MTVNRSKTLEELKEDIDFLKDKKEKDRKNWSCGDESLLKGYSTEYSRRISRGEVLTVTRVEAPDKDHTAEEDYCSDDCGD